MGLSCKPQGKMRSRFAKLENQEQKKKSEALKQTSKKKAEK